MRDRKFAGFEGPFDLGIAPDVRQTGLKDPLGDGVRVLNETFKDCEEGMVKFQKSYFYLGGAVGIGKEERTKR